MKTSVKYKIFIGLASTVFCVGFLISLVNGYHDFNYHHFMEIGRKDLIARLGFLSWTAGFIYYPSVIIILLITSAILKRTGKNIIESQWIYLVTPAFLIGLLFYTHSIDFIIMGGKRYWTLGLIVMILGVLTYWLSHILRIKDIKNCAQHVLAASRPTPGANSR